MAVAGEDPGALVRRRDYATGRSVSSQAIWNVYGDYLEQAFAMYEIPVFMDHKRSILLNSFVEYIRSLLEYGSTELHIRKRVPVSADQSGWIYLRGVDRLENYVIGLGIKGYKRWQERWTPL